jgi:hypothetical protein
LQTGQVQTLPGIETAEVAAGPEVFQPKRPPPEHKFMVVVFLDQRSEKIPVSKFIYAPKLTQQLCSIANRNNTSDVN